MSDSSQVSEGQADSALDELQPIRVGSSRFGWMQARRGSLAGWCAALAFGLMVAAALDLRTANVQRLIEPGVLKMLLGGLALLVAVRLSPNLPELPAPLAIPLSAARRLWWLFAGAGALLLGILAEINGGLLKILFLKDVSTHAQYWLLVGGIVLLVYGMAGAPLLRLPRIRADWRVILPLGAILLLALVLRVWNLEGTVRVMLDEAHWANKIMEIEARPTLHLVAPMSGQIPFSSLFPYWQSGLVDLLGHNFVGFRFLSAIIGTLTVLATYGLARAIFDRKTALIAALLLATFPPHVHFSRAALPHIADPLFGTLALMFAVRAMRNNRRVEWALAGASLGLTQYFYEGGRLLFPPLLVAFVLVLAWGYALRYGDGMNGKWRGFMILIITAVIIGAPIYCAIIGEGKPLFGRYDESGLGSSYWRQLSADGVTTQDMLDQVSHILSSFMIYGAHRDLSVFYGGQQALILDYLLPFFLFGCFYLFWRFPSPAFVVPLWIAAGAIGNGLLRDTLVSARYYVVLPALALALAAGVRYGLAFFVPDALPTTRRGHVWRAVPVALACAIAVVQVGYYFGPHLAYFEVQVRNDKAYRDGIDAVERTIALPGNTQVYLVSRPLNDNNVLRAWLGFLSRDDDPTAYLSLRSVSPDMISHKYLLDLPGGVNYAFFVDPNDANVLQLLARYFPDAEPPQYSPWDIPASKEYVLVFVPSSAIPPREPRK